ncbi:MAG: hypothetical protein WBW34_06655 [Nitrososphaeraceae archaeon]
MCEICKQQELEKAHKALSLNGDTSSIYNQTLRLLSASSRKPTLHIRRLGFTGHSPNNIKLKIASSIPCPEQLMREKEKAVKAMSLNYGF